MTHQRALKVALCSWASGIGGGAARMESYYYNFFDRSLISPTLISLTNRDANAPSYGGKIPFVQLDQSSRFGHLLELFNQIKFDVVLFQGSFDPLVCEVAKHAKIPVLIEVLHNIERGGLFPVIDHSVCVSQTVSRVQDENRSHSVILNGIDLDNFPFCKNKKRGEKIVLLQVARRSKAKINLDDLAPALLKKYVNLEFWICGGEHNIQSTDKIKIFGVVDDIKAMYEKSDFLVQLSDNEPFGLVALEAMAMGLPTILSNSGGFQEIVTNGLTGYLVDGPTFDNSIAVLDEAISHYHSPRYEEIRYKAREEVQSRFDIRSGIKAFQDLILRLHAEKTGNFQSNVSPILYEVPPNALVGEALYDFQAGELVSMGERLKQLSESKGYITELNCLKTAHDLGIYLRHKRPDLYPKGLFAYLFSCRNHTLECLEIVFSELDFLSSDESVKELEHCLLVKYREHKRLHQQYLESLELFDLQDRKENFENNREVS